MRERLDRALRSRGLARSRSAAAAAIAEGRVRVDGRVVDRASALTDTAQDIEVEDAGWVGRAARKLDAALDAFGVEVAGRLALDLGASTGGFTQVLLTRGARRVIALDVGHDQLVPELRADPRVTVVEGVNARFLDAPRVRALTAEADLPDVITADLSFISLRQVLPAIAAAAASTADLILLVKPQFEVGRPGIVAGIVRDPRLRTGAVLGVLDAASALGLGGAGILRSPIEGAEGNVEVLVHLTRAADAHPSEWLREIEHATRSSGRSAP